MTTQDMNHNPLIDKVILDDKVIMYMNHNSFEIIDGQAILHDKVQETDKVILNHEQVAAIKLLFEALKNDKAQ